MVRIALEGLAILAFLILVLMAVSSPARAGSLFVATNGVDSADCGGKKSPCRSLTQAIRNARDGDKISVGPGHYGNLNEDHDFDDPGEERQAEVGTGCRCMIKIDKRLAITSTHGAELTLLNAGGVTGSSSSATDVVEIAADGVVFGGRGRGFTLMSGDAGVDVAPRVADAVVSGNIAVENENGFDAFQLRGGELSGNVAIANRGAGFAFSCDGPAYTCVARDNQALGNGSFGFYFFGAVEAHGNAAISNGSDGFHAVGEGLVAAGNLASANGGSGFRLNGDFALLENNSAVGNDASGVEMGDDVFLREAGHSLVGNQLLGNVSAGIHMRRLTRRSNTIHGNAIFGNYGFASGICDVRSDTTYANPDSLAGNWWGTPDGPYDGRVPGLEPSMLGGVCDTSGSRLLLEGHAKKPAKLKLKKSKRPW